VSRARRASARSPVGLSRCRCSCRAGPGSIGAPATEIDDHVACFPRKRPLCQGDHETAAASWLRRASGDRSKKTANRTAAARGPSAGPKPESMMVPRGARRSDQKAHPSRLEQARRFLPSWSCEFDSRHPLQRHNPLSGAVSRPVIERGDAASNRGRLVISGRSWRCAGAGFTLVRKPFEVRLPAFSGDHQPDSRATHGPQPSMTVRNDASAYPV
jgi:hypothetical protein